MNVQSVHVLTRNALAEVDATTINVFGLRADADVARLRLGSVAARDPCSQARAKLHIDRLLENLVLLCNRHHHLIHRPGWHLKLLPNADLDVTFPDGTTRTSQPRGQPTRLGP